MPNATLLIVVELTAIYKYVLENQACPTVFDSVVALFEAGVEPNVKMTLFVVIVLVNTALAADLKRLPVTVTLALNTVFAGIAPMNALTVIFLETGTPFGSSMTNNRSSGSVEVRLVKAEIFLSAIVASHCLAIGPPTLHRF